MISRSLPSAPGTQGFCAQETQQGRLESPGRAVSYGDRPIITALKKSSLMESFETFKSSRAHAYKALNAMGDFYLELTWNFHTWSEPQYL